MKEKPKLGDLVRVRYSPKKIDNLGIVIQLSDLNTNDKYTKIIFLGLRNSGRYGDSGLELIYRNSKLT